MTAKDVQNFEEIAGRDPFETLENWYEQATKSEPADPNAMALATVDDKGLPNVRIVLMKGIDDAAAARRGIVFYTNLESAKGLELQASGKAAVAFHWKSLARQVRLRGLIDRVSDDEANEYFASRPRDSRIGAWASAQSRPLSGRDVLEEAVRIKTAKFAGREVPRPPNWSGFRLTPLEIEFWQAGDFRLHDRIVFRRGSPSAAWTPARLYP